MWLDEILEADQPCDDDVLERSVRDATPGTMVIECGVFRGASLRRMCDANPAKTIFGFDSFLGLPEDWRPPYSAGAFACTPPRVPKNGFIITGDIAETLPRFLRKHRRWIGFCHLDMDVYSSTRDALAAIEMRLIKGSVILFDEIRDTKVGDCNAQHEQRAFREFIDRTGYKFEFAGRRHPEAYAFRML